MGHQTSMTTQFQPILSSKTLLKHSLSNLTSFPRAVWVKSRATSQSALPIKDSLGLSLLLLLVTSISSISRTINFTANSTWTKSQSLMTTKILHFKTKNTCISSSWRTLRFCRKDTSCLYHRSQLFLNRALCSSTTHFKSKSSQKWKRLKI